MSIDPPPSLRPHRKIGDDLAYILPMAVFLALTWLSGEWPSAFAWIYAVKTAATATVLILLWPHYTPIRWHSWWLGVLVGAIGIVQWIGMQMLLERYIPFFRPGPTFDPVTAIAHPAARYAFFTVRLLDAVLVVPVMEELFWRDFLWRSILAPADFKLAAVGEFPPGQGWITLLVVSAAFCSVHGNWWLTAFIWGLAVGGLLAWTKSLGVCILAHATSNLLLGIYVLHTHNWSLW